MNSKNLERKHLTNKHLTLILVVAYVLISIYPLFAFLGTLTLRTWDESRLAISAYEMSKTGNPIVVTYNYLPDHWSVKPPLTIISQAISIKLFGLNENAVRLPSAISMVLLGVFIILLTGKLNRPWIGFYSSVVIICSKGFYLYHSARTADYDAMLIMFMVLYSLLFFVYTEKKEIKYYMLFFVALILATLTKGIQALLPLPFIFLYALFAKQLIGLFKNKFTYIGLGLFVLFVGGYYFGREIMDNGYLQAVCDNELGGRFSNTLEGHHGGNDFYFLHLQDDLFSYFFWIISFAFVLNLLGKGKIERRMSLYSFGVALTIFLVITIGKTKLDWYVFPVIPFLAIVLGISFSTIHHWLLGLNKNKLASSIIILVGFLTVFYPPYKEIVTYVYKPVEHPWYYPYYSRLYTMRKIAKKELVFNRPVVYVNNDNQQDYLFYIYMMNENGVANERKDVSKLKTGDIVQVYEPRTEEEIKTRFKYETLYSYVQTKIIRLSSEIKDKK